MYNEQYDIWKQKATDDADLTKELNDITGKGDEIKDRFAATLAFGTAGLRGVLGAGTNRMNIYMVRKATQGLANFLNAQNGNGKSSVAISYDSRIKSDVFAKEAACVLAANGIKAHIYNQLMPVPALSFATRELKCDAGIMVTASHNPAKYNGYKAYGPDGCQMTEDAANGVYEEMKKTDVFEDVKLVSFDDAVKSGDIQYISDEVIEKLYKNIKAQSVRSGLCETAGLKLIYTPLNGSGNVPVRRILSDIGIKDVSVVKEQEMPDGNFPTCPYPNPEIKQTLELGLKMAQNTGADMVLATDPDADRVGTAVKNDSGTDYVLLTGNEIGVLLLDYLCAAKCEAGTMPKDPVTVSSVVSTSLAPEIAKNYGVEHRSVLTGFKYIGEQILMLEEKGEEERFIFGFEESYGYLAGTYVRDKDAVVASMLICEMAAYYKSQGSSVLKRLDEIYKKYGYYLHKIDSFEFEGLTGMEKMSAIMAKLRQSAPPDFAGYKVVNIQDYETQVETDIQSGATKPITLPKANMLIYTLDGGASVIVRPSGTEPKIKVYYSAKAQTLDEATKMYEQLAKAAKPMLLGDN